MLFARVGSRERAVGADGNEGLHASSVQSLHSSIQSGYIGNPSIAHHREPIANKPQGIGLGIADCSLANGASRVYSIDIGEPGDEFAAVSSRYPDRLFALQADVTKEDSIQAAVDRVIAEAGALHGMVCNAGRTKHKPALDFTTEEIEQLWGVNVRDFGSESDG